MSPRKQVFLHLGLVALLCSGCFTDNDDNVVTTSEINDFVYRGMNVFYLYKDNVPDLDNDLFLSDNYNNYLNSFSSPEQLFESLIYNRETIDRFSWIVDDYFELERQFQGISGTNGMEFSLFSKPNSNNGVFGVVRLVLPNSDADNKGLKRGDLFFAVNGEDLFFNSENDNNLDIFNNSSYTLNLGVYDDKNTTDESDDTIETRNEDILLTKSEYTENPIFNTNIYDVNGENVGYLMLNGFTAGYAQELNNVFNDFKANNIKHLIVDLRYNPGGSVSLETDLASMITGQFTGQLFKRLVYNSNFEATDYNFTSKLENGDALNSLELNKIYILATGRSASASEGLINSLKAYIDVVQIGTNTTGKTQASRTIYDSPDNNYRRQGANPNHTYAMQPLIAEGVNKDNLSVPNNGLVPDIDFWESALNYGIIGDENEPFLALALAEIENSSTKLNTIKAQSEIFNFNPIKDSDDFIRHQGGMIID
ncbi:S41 family peptidase [Seonamhaeicola sp. ML3]|uniref:S41 family peptidase n=1 Tax=Seonamhaeicola sp. ML3 TaxID=2937786 RepID=UPI00200C45E9|nr:S41 family peptidase [Seonamhaeicola sp. ML3]